MQQRGACSTQAPYPRVEPRLGKHTQRAPAHSLPRHTLTQIQVHTSGRATHCRRLMTTSFFATSAVREATSPVRIQMASSRIGVPWPNGVGAAAGFCQKITPRRARAPTSCHTEHVPQSSKQTKRTQPHASSREVQTKRFGGQAQAHTLTDNLVQECAYKKQRIGDGARQSLPHRTAPKRSATSPSRQALTFQPLPDIRAVSSSPVRSLRSDARCMAATYLVTARGGDQQPEAHVVRGGNGIDSSEPYVHHKGMRGNW